MRPRSEAGLRVAAVVVAYRPEPARLARVLAALTPQVDATIVVDNAQGAGLEGVAFGPCLERLDMHGNAGVAAAQNAGLQHAFAQGASHVLVLDHDSVPADGMVDTLLQAWLRLTSEGQRVAAVGANSVDPRRPDVSPFVRIGTLRTRHVRVNDPSAVLPVSFLISSGSLISAAAFAAIGPMEARLFVDYIDVEWCLRAAGLGWTCHGVAGARMEHALGDEPLDVLGRRLPVRSPARHYYTVRNAVWLIQRSALPRRWKRVETLRMICFAAIYVFWAPQRSRHARAMWRGLQDGLRERMGADLG
jgi:rhamnosyltransferase